MVASSLVSVELVRKAGATHAPFTGVPSTDASQDHSPSHAKYLIGVLSAPLLFPTNQLFFGQSVSAWNQLRIR